MSPFTSLVSGILIAPATTSLPLPPPPPPPPPSDDDSADEGDDSDDDGDDEDDHNGEGFDPPQPTVSSSSQGAAGSTSILSSLLDRSSMLPSSSSAFAISVPTESGEPTESTLPSSTTSQFSDFPQTSSTTAFYTATSTSSNQAPSTPLPVGQPDSSLETKAGSSPLGTAGIVLAAIFGVIALVTTIYLLFRLRRRRKSYIPYLPSNSSGDPAKSTYASTTQETGIIFGSRRSSLRNTPNPYAQQDDQPTRQRTIPGRSRFSFLNRRWYSTGTQVSDSQPLKVQYRDQNRRSPQYNHHHDQDFNKSPLTQSRWITSFTSLSTSLGLGVGQANTRSQSRTNSQFCPPVSHSLAQQQQITTTADPSITNMTPKTPSTITRLTTEIFRTISTRSDTSESGSGYARAYAHHGFHYPSDITPISPPPPAAVAATSSPFRSPDRVWSRSRSTISSISTAHSRWLSRRRSNRHETNNTNNHQYNTQQLQSPISPASFRSLNLTTAADEEGRAQAGDKIRDIRTRHSEVSKPHAAPCAQHTSISLSRSPFQSTPAFSAQPESRLASASSHHHETQQTPSSPHLNPK